VISMLATHIKNCINRDLLKIVAGLLGFELSKQNMNSQWRLFLFLTTSKTATISDADRMVKIGAAENSGTL